MIWKPQRIGFGCLLVALLVGVGHACAQMAADPHLRNLLHTAAAPDQPAFSGKYVGPGSCSAGACHGGIQPRSQTKVLQNEFSTWVTVDKHTRAYTSLTEPLGRQIGAILKIGAPEKAQRCLICHALSVPEPERARSFEISEGVSCENCHGAASGWLGPHIQPTAVHQDMVKLGLIDNKNLAKRTERCLTCHLGAPGMNVDHELIAAGHPDLKFELDSYTAVEPPHWVEKGPNGGPADPLFGVRAWAVGEAVELQESMLRVARHAKSGPWPEFSEMDCMTCHHSLTGPQSWRQQTGFKGHRAGDAPYNLSRYVLFKHFASELSPQLNDELNAEVSRVAALVTSMSPDRAGVAAAADRAAQLAGRMVAEVRDASYDTARTDRLLRSITADADALSVAGERTAERTLLTVNALYIAEIKAGSPNAATRQAIDGLFPLVKNESAYNAPQFAAQLKKVQGTLR